MRGIWDIVKYINPHYSPAEYLGFLRMVVADSHQFPRTRKSSRSDGSSTEWLARYLSLWPIRLSQRLEHEPRCCRVLR